VTQAILWPLVAGIGLLLLLTAQPVGRPRPSLARRLAALQPDPNPAEPAPAVFSTPGLDAALVPPLRASGKVILRLAALLGVPTSSLARRLELAGVPGGPAVFAGQKLLAALVGLGLLPLCNQLAVTPFGAWPTWTWLACALAGFLAPDLGLANRVARRRRELLAGLGAATEFLALAVSAGCGLEQALAEAATTGDGPFFAELARRLAHARLQGQRATQAITRMAEQVGLPELAALAGALEAGTTQGTPILQTLRAQAQAARERRRLALLAAGERAQVAMILPVGALVLPAFFLVILYPAAVVVLRVANP
jgi:tight adherence protein C